MYSLAVITYTIVVVALSLVVHPIHSAWWTSSQQPIQQDKQREQEHSWTDSFTPSWMHRPSEWDWMNQELSPWNFALHPSQLARLSSLKAFNPSIRTRLAKGFYTCELDVPGFTAQDIQARINANEYGCKIDISASKKCGSDDTCFDRSIEQSIRLPSDAECPLEKMSSSDVEKVQMGVENGVLRVRVARGDQV
jgi:HSP20 family molecular chaperone IbpA